MSIDAYVQGFTTRFDQLALLGKPFDIEDQIEFVLEGLPDDYKKILDQIESRETTPSLTEIHEKLLNHEVKLQTKTPVSSVPPVTANASHFCHSSNTTNSRNNSHQSRSNNNRGSQTWQQQQQFGPRADQQPRGYQG